MYGVPGTAAAVPVFGERQSGMSTVNLVEERKLCLWRAFKMKAEEVCKVGWGSLWVKILLGE